MLWGDDRLDDIGDVVDVGEGLDAEQDIIEGLLGRMCGVFGCSNDCRTLEWR